MKLTHRDAERRYSDFREVARDSVNRRLPYPDKNKISLRGIDDRALTESGKWELMRDRQVDWPWMGGYRNYSYSYPKRFELAIWYNDLLCSLSLGRPSYMGSRLRLEFIESRPEEHPLRGRVTPIVVSVAEVYAVLIGASQLRIIDPVDRRLIEYYSSFSYLYRDGSGEKGAHYLVKDLL